MSWQQTAVCKVSLRLLYIINHFAFFFYLCDLSTLSKFIGWVWSSLETMYRNIDEESLFPHWASYIQFTLGFCEYRGRVVVRGAKAVMI